MPRPIAYKKTKEVMENYNRLCVSKDGFASGRGQTKSDLIIAYVNKCLGLIEKEQAKNKCPEKYEAFHQFYVDDVTQERIAENLYTTDRTVRRWITEITEILSIYLFGMDAIVVDLGG